MESAKPKNPAAQWESAQAHTLGWSLKGPRFFLAVLLLLVGCATDARSDSQDSGHWQEYGIKWEISDQWYLKGDTQLRLRENWQDLHYVRLELGPGVRLGKHFDFLVMYRFNPTESGGQWRNTHFVILDPTVTLRVSRKWAFDIRNRFQVKLGERGRGFWRPRVRATRKFSLGKRKVSWYGANEFFIQTTSLGLRSRVNQNRFSTGLRFSLAPKADFETYYLLRSDQASGGTPWAHLHVFGTSLFLKLQ